MLDSAHSNIPSGPTPWDRRAFQLVYVIAHCEEHLHCRRCSTLQSHCQLGDHVTVLGYLR